MPWSVGMTIRYSSSKCFVSMTHTHTHTPSSIPATHGYHWASLGGQVGLGEPRAVKSRSIVADGSSIVKPQPSPEACSHRLGRKASGTKLASDVHCTLAAPIHGFAVDSPLPTPKAEG